MNRSRIDRREFLKAAASLSAIAALTPRIPLVGESMAVEDWKPERPIQVVIQFAAGGGTDTVTRALTKAMEPVIGQRINAINMTGALGAVAAQYVWTRPADGYTWLGAADFSRYFRIMKVHETAAWRDWQYCQSAVSLASWSVHPDSPIKTFADLIEVAKANPGKLTISSDGKGGLWHEASAIVADAADFTYRNVPYDGGAPATLAALKKEVDVAGSGLHEQIEFVRAGKLRHLAVFTPEAIDVAGAGRLHSVVEYVPAAKAYAPFGGMYNIALKRETPLPILLKIKKAVEYAVEQESFRKTIEKRIIKKLLVFGKDADRKAAMLETNSASLFKKLGIGKADPEELGLPRPGEFNKWWPPKDYKPLF